MICSASIALNIHVHPDPVYDLSFVFCGRDPSEEVVSPLLTYRSGDISETTLMKLSSDILNSWNKTHSGILLVL